MNDATAAEQPAALRCAAHPAVETYLRCGRCETPICPRCMIMTPVGARCRACARLKKLPMFELRPRDYLRGLGGGLAAAVAGGAALAVLPGLGFFGLLIMLGLGYATGEASTAAANRKRGTALAALAAIALPIGLIIGRTLMLLLLVESARSNPASVLAIAALGLAVPIWSLLLLLAAMAIAFSRVR